MSQHSDNRNIRVMQFLDAYQKQESLWNPALESYKNKTARDEAYLHIIKELNTPALTIRDIKLKVKSIRTTYTKELRILTKHKEEGKQYSPKLFWFNRANAFLKDVSLSRDKRCIPDKQNVHEDQHYKTTNTCDISYLNDTPAHRRSFSIVDDLDEIDGEDTEERNHQQQHQNIHNHNHHSVPNSNSSYEYKIRSTDLTTATTMATAASAHDDDGGGDVSSAILGGGDEVDDDEPPIPSKTEISTHNELHTYCTGAATVAAITNGNVVGADQVGIGGGGNYSGGVAEGFCLDEYDHFCRSVAAQLRRITDSYSRAVAKLKIQQILFEAETGHYRNNPTITIPVSQHINNL